MTIPFKIKRLLDNPALLGDTSKEARLMQTHISYVILTDKYVYKIKKPVKFIFLDFSTLEKRKHYCQEEIKINKRLAPSLYLKVIALKDKNKKTTDYAVKMKRIDEKNIFENMITGNSLNKSHIVKLANHISRFYKNTENVSSSKDFDFLKNIELNTSENFRQLENKINKVFSKKDFLMVENYTTTFIKDNEKLFAKRIDDNFIKDCHGDLHCDHIVLNKNKIEIFDAIEFNYRFRYIDQISDISFLLMDLDFRNRADLSSLLLINYLKNTKDREGKKLVTFYKVYRALVRAKVESFKMDEMEVPKNERLVAKIKSTIYFSLAKKYALRDTRPVIMLFRGLPGTGKTHIAKEIKRLTNYNHLRTDEIRKQYFSKSKDIYSKKVTEKTYNKIALEAGKLLKENKNIIIDGNFRKKSQVDIIKKLAKERGAKLFIFEFRAFDKEVLKNMKRRDKDKMTDFSDADYLIYKKLKKDFTLIKDKKTVINFKGNINKNTEKIIFKVFN